MKMGSLLKMFQQYNAYGKEYRSSKALQFSQGEVGFTGSAPFSSVTQLARAGGVTCVYLLSPMKRLVWNFS